MARVALIAPGSPPLTGASIISTPSFEHSWNIFCDIEGAMELMSMMIEPFFAPAKTPPSPKIALSESAESGSIVIIVSVLDATSSLLVAGVAPSLASSSTASDTMS